MTEFHTTLKMTTVGHISTQMNLRNNVTRENQVSEEYTGLIPLNKGCEKQTESLNNRLLISYTMHKSY